MFADIRIVLGCQSLPRFLPTLNVFAYVGNVEIRPLYIDDKRFYCVRGYIEMRRLRVEIPDV